MQNAQPTTNCAKWIPQVDYLSISKQQKNFGVFKMQGRVTIGHMATRLHSLYLNTRYQIKEKIILNKIST